ncbi:hypothetical protein E5K00_10070 [Hymenobacter aquaticus]|uniref:Uncharacterized protein n=1 Tax=Hymenobacter aquaticus TaxID=1867101 RepID=A0A4Z0Q758_9BACT|nr:DUF6625 family protein [Hymenobacter aquaticus]TGE25514.1 hypothetical protein E5K00_10070 [Hymenobacter aquaticus]
MQHSICLVICYFGRSWPAYFPHFLASCAANPTVSFLVFTNLAAPPAPPNTRFVHLPDLAAFNALASRTLGFPVAVTDPYKLCDLKPAYGVIFAEYLASYAFWGYCDIDLLFGDIRRFLPAPVLDHHDVLSAVAQYPAGFFLLFRNTPAISRLFMRSPDYQRVFQSARHFCFDECNFKFGELLGAGQLIEEVETEIQSLAHVLSAQARQGTIRWYGQTLGEEFMLDTTPVVWQPGRVYNTATQHEFLLVHLVNVKTNPTFLVEPFRPGAPCYVSARGLTHSPRPTWHTALRVGLLRSRAWAQRTRWRAWVALQRARSLVRPASYPHLDQACYIIGNLKCTFYFQEKNRYCVVSDFKGQLGLQQCQVFAAPDGRQVLREAGRISVLSGSGSAPAETPFKIEIHNLQTQAREVGYLLHSPASQ